MAKNKRTTFKPSRRLAVSKIESPAMTAEEARSIAQKEGLTLIKATRSNSSTGFKGVSRQEGLYVVTYWDRSLARQYELGSFASAEEAALIYARHDREQRAAMPAAATVGPAAGEEEPTSYWHRTKAWSSAEVRGANVLNEVGASAQGARNAGRQGGGSNELSSSCVASASEAVPESCSICMDALDGSNEWGRTPCGHDFHVECLRDWRLMRGGDACPVCRHPLAASRRMFESIGEALRERTTARAGKSKSRGRGEMSGVGAEVVCLSCLGRRHVAHVCGRARKRSARWLMSSR